MNINEFTNFYYKCAAGRLPLVFDGPSCRQRHMHKTHKRSEGTPNRTCSTNNRNQIFMRKTEGAHRGDRALQRGDDSTKSQDSITCAAVLQKQSAIGVCDGRIDGWRCAQCTWTWLLDCMLATQTMTTAIRNNKKYRHIMFWHAWRHQVERTICNEKNVFFPWENSVQLEIVIAH